MNSIQEPARKLPVSARCQVLVAGGGFAGVSAALAAARCGREVILLEREFLLGGLGTAGLITIYLPICDGMGHQVCYGINDELIRLSIKHGAEGRYPRHWFCDASVEQRRSKGRFEVQYNPHLMAMEMEALLRRSGVRILYGTIAAGTVVEDERIINVIVENKSGRSAISVESVIDCTGDADLAAMSGAPICLNEDKNPLAAWYYSITDRQLRLNQLGLADVRNDQGRRAQTLAGTLRVSGVDAWETSRFVETAHEAILRDVEKRRGRGKNTTPVTIAAIPQLRMTRRLQGETLATHLAAPEDVLDSVGLYADWTKSGPVYALPLGSMYHRSVKNLLVAGRCLSADRDMWNLTRVIPVCVVSGQAAGTAFGLAADLAGLNISQLQSKLRQDGIRLYPSEITEI